MKKKEALGFVILTLFLGMITVSLIFSFVEEYNLAAATEEQGIVTDKVGEKGLFTPPYYYVRVELPNGEESQYLHRVSKQQIDNLDIGDKIDGLTIHGSFFTMRDFIYESLFFIGAILLFGLVTLLVLFVLISEIPFIKRLINKTFLGRPAKENGYKILIVMTIIFAYVAGRFLLNLYRKIIPIGQTKTEAVIIDELADRSFRRHEDSRFEFSIQFKNEHGENIEVIKEVTANTFEKYFVGDNIPISYRNGNHYDVFINEMTTTDLIQSLFYHQSIMYIVMTVLVLIIGYILIKKKSK